MQRLAIIGGGDLGIQIAHYVANDNQFNTVGFFDDFTSKLKNNSFPILGSLNDIEKSYEDNKFDCLLVGIGYNHIDFRKEVFLRFKNNIPFAIFIHSSCYIDSSVKIEEGTIIYPKCILDAHVAIKNNVLLNLNNTISHNTVIKSHSFLAPRVAIAGKCSIGEKNILGINSTIIDNIKTVSKVTIGAGAVVNKDINKSGLYVGNPIRFVR